MVTSRGGREVSERRSGIEENERKSVIARLAAPWRDSNLVIPVKLRKRNHTGEAQVRRQKSFVHQKEGLLRGPHEEAEKQRKALRRGKNLAFSEDTLSEKERVRLKVTPKKVAVALKRRGS